LIFLSSILVGSFANLVACVQDKLPYEEWNKTFGGKNDGIGFALRQTSDGGYILGCNKWTRARNWDFWLVKTDASGNEQWNKTYGGELADSLPSYLPPYEAKTFFSNT
jgi:hypothetical protein